MDPQQIRYFLFSDSSEIQEIARQIGIPYIFPLKKGNFYQLYTSIFCFPQKDAAGSPSLPRLYHVPSFILPVLPETARVS